MLLLFYFFCSLQILKILVWSDDPKHRNIKWEWRYEYEIKAAR